MAFDPTPVTAIRTYIDGADLLIAWETTAPDGTYYQVYIDHRCVWRGIATQCVVPIPVTEATIHVGVVSPTEIDTDYSGSLDSIGGGGNRVTLNWTGGTYLDPTGADDVVGFHIYMSAVADGPVDYSTVAGSVSAYPGGVILDGWGLGRWGYGGWGRADSQYRWTSPPVTSGVWAFSVETYNAAGIESPALALSQAVITPPNAPAFNANGQRLTYVYDEPSRVPTLYWLPPD